MKLSIIVPVYGAPKRLPELLARVTEQAIQICDDKFEVIMIDDACPKGSWDVIQAMAADSNVLTGIKLSRNFGQHYAILAGLENSKGEWVVVMDCDLQDVPEEISNLYNKATKGYDIVLASRTVRNDSYFKKLGSKLFYQALSYATNTTQNSNVANFGIYNRKVVNALLEFKEQLRFLPVNVRWLGFKLCELEVSHQARDVGKSSYSLAKLIKLALNVIFSFSNKPMSLLINLGAVISSLSVLVAGVFIVRYLLDDITVPGWTGIMVSLWFMFGVILSALGVIGLYVAKTFDETKSRPLYVIDQIISPVSSK